MVDTKEASFGWQVICRAWFGAWAFFDSWKRDLVFFPVTLAVGGAYYLRDHGWPKNWNEGMDAVIHAATPAVIIWLALFVWHLWLAPAGLVYEAIKKSDHGVSASTSPKKTAQNINWQPWRFRTKYLLYEFAKILSKSDPALQSLSPEGSSYLRLLIEEANGGKIRISPQMDTTWDGSRFVKDIDGYNEIDKKTAIEWAEAKSFPIDHIK